MCSIVIQCVVLYGLLFVCVCVRCVCLCVWCTLLFNVCVVCESLCDVVWCVCVCICVCVFLLFNAVVRFVIDVL